MNPQSKFNFPSHKRAIKHSLQFRENMCKISEPVKTSDKIFFSILNIQMLMLQFDLIIFIGKIC